MELKNSIVRSLVTLDFAQKKQIKSLEDFMKKFTAIVVSLLMAGALFAQKIPEGRNLVAAVYDFAQPENWGGVDSVTYDIQNDTYVIKA